MVSLKMVRNSYLFVINLYFNAQVYTEVIPKIEGLCILHTLPVLDYCLLFIEQRTQLFYNYCTIYLPNFIDIHVHAQPFSNTL